MTNILYTSCHEVLEYDEVKLLSQIEGINIRSCGAYVDPTQGCAARPPINMATPPEEHIQASYRFNTEDHVLNDDLLKWADIVVYMHMPEWLHKSVDILDKYPRIPIVYRSIGQSSPSVETMLGNYKKHFGSRFRIVRYSPNEQYFSSFAGSDGLIRFYKDPEEWYGWELPAKEDRVIMHAMQAAISRGDFGHIREALDASKGLPRVLVGPSNEDCAGEIPVANPPFEQYRYALRNAGVLLYTGMVPASYTLTFIEAAMTGVPIISISGQMWSNEHKGWCDYHVLETPELVSPSFTVTNWAEASEMLATILDNEEMLLEMSQMNREFAVRLFNKKDISEQWKSLINSL